MAKKKKLLTRLIGRLKHLPTLLIISIIVLIIGTFMVRTVYINSLKPVSSSTTTTYFTVSSGMSVDKIASGLKNAGLIKSSSAFKNYLRTNELNEKLQAGTYIISPSMSVQQIVAKMISGDVAKNLLTILPGKRIDEIKEAFSKAGYTAAQIDRAFNASNYLGHPVLKYLPKGASLEGFLYPDSFQKTTETSAETIVRESLDEMEKHLSADIIADFANHGLSPYQGIILTSIVYQETGDTTYMPTVAQVFLSRLSIGMMLQSNVTANYAADIAGKTRDVTIDSPYNTYLIKGLPPGPISNVTDNALKAVAHPDTTDYLYFIAGDDGKMYFSRTQAEHNQAISQHCKNCALSQ